MQNPPASDWNLEYKFHWQGKGSKTVLVYLTWGLYSHKVRMVLANHMISACAFPRVNNCNKIDEWRHKECENNGKCSWRLVFSSFSNIHETRPTNLATCKQAFTVSLWVILTKIIFCPFFAQDLIPGATFIGVGFDGRGEYSPDSSKIDLVQRACKRKQRWVINYII